MVHDDVFSVSALFLGASTAVQLALLALLGMSVFSWWLVGAKWLSFRRALLRADDFEVLFWETTSLDELFREEGSRPSHPMAATFAAGMREWRRSSDASVATPVMADRMNRVMGASIQRELAKHETGVGALATIGATAPFVGLFGTVWGIMHSFRAIAQSQDTQLAVVAPGIAEALFATAFGLFVAIPAVVFHNRFAGDLNRLASRLESFADEFWALASRQSEPKA